MNIISKLNGNGFRSGVIVTWNPVAERYEVCAPNGQAIVFVTKPVFQKLVAKGHAFILPESTIRDVAGKAVSDGGCQIFRANAINRYGYFWLVPDTEDDTDVFSFQCWDEPIKGADTVTAGFLTGSATKVGLLLMNAELAQRVAGYVTTSSHLK